MHLNVSTRSHNEMERGLTNRHVQFIAIGGTIGTGLFLGSGESIALTGPSIVLVYIAVGLVMYLMMRAIGELMYADPDQHTFINFINRYCGPAVGKFALGSYWVALLLVGMTELSAVGAYFVSFFGTFGIDLSSWKWVIELVFLVALIGLNTCAVKMFGETEFWFSMIKITLIIAMIVTAVVMLIIGFHYGQTSIPGQDHPSPGAAVSLANVFNGFSLAPNGWAKFLMSFQMVFFAYTLIEFVGVTVSETKDPRHVIPKAINNIIMRVLIFYVGALLAIMTIVPWRNFQPNEDGSYTSPFIMVFEYAGLDWAAALVFFVVLTASSSALNSLLYSAGRHLYQIAGNSASSHVKGLHQVSHQKVPARAIAVSGALVGICVIVSMFPQISGSFVLFSSAASAVIIFIYILTMIAHYCYRRSSDFMPNGFLMPAYKFLDPLGILFFVFIYVTLFIGNSTRGPAIVSFIWFVVFGVFCLIRYPMKRPHNKNADLITTESSSDKEPLAKTDSEESA
ncbi:amino acid permease [Bifidobacterium dolichotidis]|nr:amino acid permease [Bifidobacterium dolichotidis]